MSPQRQAVPRRKLTRGRRTKLRVLVAFMVATVTIELFVLFFTIIPAVGIRNPMYLGQSMAMYFLVTVPVVFMAAAAVEGLRCFSLRSPVPLESFWRTNVWAYAFSIGYLISAFVFVNALLFLSVPDEYLQVVTFGRMFLVLLPMIVQTVLTGLGKRFLRGKKRCKAVSNVAHAIDERLLS